MILVLGGAAAGKLSYVKSLGYTDADVADGELDSKPVLYNLQKIVFANPGAADGLAGLLSAKAVVICDEVGSGVIPVSRGERLYREAVGRLCIRLAERAERVVRVVAGIPAVIKETSN
ncbi:MAG: bifunctional adenosylcobinamide kinase/adenosylcobinamide-phosphate guanylyltransferase [Oscillospiraceae bacterium]|jgi:adenosyl cobinamide kinase/adenosyl cobinamide phosphate guanylyltransferase|nr:bifunctional adenosylcobinamide kinase/adenosylcobinamide-phosphate guanylyltransferase [Oscillospiraceae bacterium]